MFIGFRQPCTELQSHVQSIMIVHEHLSPLSEKTLFRPFPPAAEQCMYFYPREKSWLKDQPNKTPLQQPFCILVGPQVSSVELGIVGEHIMIGFMFKPGGLHRLIGVPMTKLLGQALNGSLVWPAAIRQLEEQMAATDDCLAMVALAEDFLKKQYAKNTVSSLPIDAVLKTMSHAASPYSIDQLASMACLSTRQFDRKFYERIGMSPKQFMRIARFSTAFRMKERCPDVDWLTVALHCGYYDFQHMLRDFKEFVGTTPTLFLASEALTNSETTSLFSAR
ncbi:MAG TPA: helix-turn-helix domain-containing protein [Chryseolinea sp.]